MSPLLSHNQQWKTPVPPQVSIEFFSPVQSIATSTLIVTCFSLSKQHRHHSAPKAGPGSNSLAFQRASGPLCFCTGPYPLDLLLFSTVVPYLVTHRQARLVVLPGARGKNAKLVRKLNKMNWNYLQKTDEEDTSFSKNQWVKKVICLRKINETKWADHGEDFSHKHGPCLTSDVFRPACWWQHNLSFCYSSSQTLMCTTCHHPASDSSRYGVGPENLHF